MPITQKEQKNLRALQTIKGRKEQARFVAEGVRVLEESLKSKQRPTRVFFSEHLLSERGSILVERFKSARVQCESISARQIDQISDSRSSQGLLAVFASVLGRFDESFLLRHRRILLCDNISDPGNLGTMLRSALAFGFTGVILTGHTTDAYAPKVVRASAGSIFSLEIVTGTYQAIESAIGRGVALLIASDPKGEKIFKVDFDKERSIIVAVGAEAEGLSDELDRIAGRRYRIAHSDAVESLNAAIAGSIIMSEFYKAE